MKKSKADKKASERSKRIDAIYQQIALNGRQHAACRVQIADHEARIAVLRVKMEELRASDIQLGHTICDIQKEK